MRALARQRLGDRRADPAAGSGDEGEAVLQVAHGRAP
jgi:hypothetical protein